MYLPVSQNCSLCLVVFLSIRNGQSLGTAFSNIKMGPGIAYFPAISLSFKESVAFNFGSRPLRYPDKFHEVYNITPKLVYMLHWVRERCDCDETAFQFIY